jgi:hypothetical protein
MNKPLIHALFILLICLIAYSNTFEVPFHFDDRPVIVENPIIKNLNYFSSPSTAKNLKGHFNYSTFIRRYIGYLTFALNYRLHGLDVYGYHVLNLLIHILNSLLLYVFVILTFRTPYFSGSPLKDSSRYIAVFSALIFAAHPLQTQAVTYIWQRVTSLATLFYLLSLVMYMRARMSRTIRSGIMFYVLCITSAVLAMKTKEIAFMLPLTVLVYEVMFLQDGKGIKKRILYLIPILLTVLIIPLSLLFTDQPVGEIIGDISAVTRGHTELTRAEYFFTGLRVMVTYIRLLFLPVNQNLDYDYPVYSTFLSPEVALSGVFLVLVIGTGIYVLQRYKDSQPHARLISFGIFWFFLNLVLETSVIPLNFVILEHRMYLPSAGLIVAVVTAVYTGVDRLNLSARSTAVTLSILVILLGSATFVRNMVWGDEVTLWKDVVRKSPNKARAHNGLGTAYMYKGLFDRAIEQFRIAINIEPQHADAHFNLGIAYGEKGLYDDAYREMKKGLELRK